MFILVVPYQLFVSVFAVGLQSTINSFGISIFQSERNNFILQNLGEVVHDLCDFLDVKLTNAVVDNIVQHCSFQSMKDNPMTNHLDVYSIDATISPLLRKGNMIFSHLGFSECLCCLGCNIYSRLYRDYGLMLFD